MTNLWIRLAANLRESPNNLSGERDDSARDVRMQHFRVTREGWQHTALVPREWHERDLPQGGGIRHLRGGSASMEENVSLPHLGS